MSFSVQGRINKTSVSTKVCVHVFKRVSVGIFSPSFIFKYMGCHHNMSPDIHKMIMALLNILKLQVNYLSNYGLFVKCGAVKPEKLANIFKIPSS